MFGKYEISLAEATQIKNFLYKHKFVTKPSEEFNVIWAPRSDSEMLSEEMALEFEKGYSQYFKLGKTGSGPLQYNSQNNSAKFGKAHLKVTFEKNKNIIVTLTVDYLFIIVDHAGRHPYEGTLTYTARIPINDFFKI